jgi:cytochrome c oxidase subunit 2
VSDVGHGTAVSGRSSQRRRLIGWGLVLVAMLALAGCAFGADEGQTFPQSALDPDGPVARQQDNLWDLVFPIAVGVFVLVEGALIYALVRFRARDDDDRPPKQVAGNTKLEVAWTIAPAILLAGIAVPTVGTIFQLAEDPGPRALEVRVIAKQYFWTFEYTGPEGEGVKTATELHIPTERPVDLTMESVDTTQNVPPAGDPAAVSRDGVIHSFWVPNLAGKQDVVPGHRRKLTIEADEPGRYPGQCAEYCGLSHANMRFTVVAQEPGEFQAWIDRQAEPAAEPSGQLAQRGKQAFEENACFTCHAIKGYQTADGAPAEARIGPSLTHFASRQKFAGGMFETDNAEQLAAWLRNPPGEKPGAQMPNLGLAEEDIDALVAYLQSLE